MKKSFVGIVLFAILASLPLVAQSYRYVPLVPETAKSLSMGGVFASVPTAEFSYFGNPANFANKEPSLIIPAISASLYLKPTSSNIQTLAKSSGSGLATTLTQLISDNGGTGAAVSAGLGWAGKGLAIAAFLTTDENVNGSQPISATISSASEFSGIIGLGVPLQLGSLKFSVGGDIRPFYRVDLYAQGGGPLSFASYISNSNNLSNIAQANYFFGAALDLGSTVSLSDELTLGLSVRNIAPSYPVYIAKMDSYSKNPFAFKNQSGQTAYCYPDIAAGMAYTPKLLTGFIDPALYFELADPVSAYSSGGNVMGETLDMVHIGADITFLRFISLRAGLNEGYFSLGGGLRLLCLDVNAAVFTVERGPLPGDDPRSGATVSVGIRF